MQQVSGGNLCISPSLIKQQGDYIRDPVMSVLCRNAGETFPLLLMQTLPRRLLAMQESAFPEEVNKERLSSLPRSVSFNELGSSSTVHPDRETREHVQSVLTQLANEM